jgi:hypothetical protein
VGQQIIVQPDGLLAVFSSVTDSLIITDATPEELVQWRADEATKKAEEATRREIRIVKAGKQWQIYLRALTWEEASATDKGEGS